MNQVLSYVGSVVKGRLPQLGEKVLVKAAYNPGQAVPWNAVKVQTLSNQVFFSPSRLPWKGKWERKGGARGQGEVLEGRERSLYVQIAGQKSTFVEGVGLYLSKVMNASTLGSPEFPGNCPAAPAEVPSASPSACGSPGPEARDPGSSAPVDLPASPDSPTFSSEA